MANPNQAKEKPRLNERLQNWIAVLGGLTLTFFVHPFFHMLSVGPVSRFAEVHYGAGAIMPAIWWGLTALVMLALSAMILRIILTGAQFRGIARTSGL